MHTAHVQTQHTYAQRTHMEPTHVCNCTSGHTMHVCTQHIWSNTCIHKTSLPMEYLTNCKQFVNILVVCTWGMCVPALCTFVHGVLTCAINTCGVLLNVYECCVLLCLCTFARYMLTCVVDVHVFLMLYVYLRCVRLCMVCLRVLLIRVVCC